jgi:putative heme-binding domain-containing protein
MIYLGDSFPESYRNTLFTNNIHGRRINNDIPRRSGSGYVASHGPDLFRATDPWFMGVTLANGPSGEVFVSDWSDTGECHSTRNTRRETGRIFRISYGRGNLPTVDLTKCTDGELVDLQLERNDWKVRHARRLLSERSAAGRDMTAVHQRLREFFSTQVAVPQKLRALWALHVTGGLDDAFLIAALSHPGEDIRSWAVTLLCEDRSPPPAAMDRFVALAERGDSPLVRLSLASALQRIEPTQRWALATALASRGEDETDQNLPLMIWYGCEPLVDNDLHRFASLAAASKLSRLRINIARRMASCERADKGLQLLAQRLAGPLDEPVCRDLMTGMLEGVEGQRRLSTPDAWREAFDRWSDSSDPIVQDQIIRLAIVFDDERAMDKLRTMASDRGAAPDERGRAIDALVMARVEGFDSDLIRLLGDPDVRTSVLRGLAAFESPATAAAILSHYDSMTSGEQQSAQMTLVSRELWADALLDAIAANQISASELTAYGARQIRSLDNKDLTKKLAICWGEIRDTPQDKAKQIASLKKWLSDETLARADRERGEQLFVKLCGTCHQLFGQGGKIGPDITGAQRNNLDYMLENIIDPSAAVAKDYQMELLQTSDGRVVTGLIESENRQTITIQTVNERLVFPLPEIESRKTSQVSIMPQGLLDPLSEAEIRDLMGYLRRSN